MRAITPLISMVILLGITLAVAGIVASFIMNTSQRAAADANADISSSLKCSNAALGFDTGYGTLGVDWSFTGTDRLNALVVNTGSVNLYNFSMEATVAGNETDIIRLDVSQGTQRSRPDPLKPGQSVLLKAAIGQDVSGALSSLKVLNEACPAVFAKIDL